MTTHDIIANNLQHVQANIVQACDRASRSPNEVTLIAVSKRHSVNAILQAYELGIHHFGENRVQEAQNKIPQINAQLQQTNQQQPEWCMIGHIQSRKVKEVLTLFNAIHSVDSVKLASKLSKIAQETHQTPEIMLEINISGEESKSGLTAYQWQQDSTIKENLWQSFEQILKLPSLHLKGLMTMAPFLENAEATRPYFAQMRQLRDSLQSTFNVPLPQLSMGMTNDYTVAIEEGATHVRIGTAIFGERQY